MVASAVAGSSPQGAWAIINQFQIIILLPLMFGSFNTKVINYILSLEAALFSFNFISVQDWVPKNFIDTFDFHQPNEYLNIIELESGSTLINNLSLIFILTVCMIIHLLTGPIYLIFRNRDS